MPAAAGATAPMPEQLKSRLKALVAGIAQAAAHLAQLGPKPVPASGWLSEAAASAGSGTLEVATIVSNYRTAVQPVREWEERQAALSFFLERSRPHLEELAKDYPADLAGLLQEAFNKLDAQSKAAGEAGQRLVQVRDLFK